MLRGGGDAFDGATEGQVDFAGEFAKIFGQLPVRSTPSPFSGLESDGDANVFLSCPGMVRFRFVPALLSVQVSGSGVGWSYRCALETMGMVIAIIAVCENVLDAHLSLFCLIRLTTLGSLGFSPPQSTRICIRRGEYLFNL